MTSAQTGLLILIPIAYLIGSIPFGLIIGLSRGVDPRKAGSGNIGATNLGRLLGGKFFWIVFTLDLLKSLAPLLIGAWVLHRYHDAHTWLTYLLWLLIGFAAVIGHMFSLFLKFKGGKGVATSAGVVLGLFPYFTYPGLVTIGIFIVVFMLTRYVSLASIIGAASFPILYVIAELTLFRHGTADRWPLMAMAFLLAGLVIFRHRTNIARLRAGTENRFTRKPR
jgi:acyl phosphate:glycerol-3-phosphate acyltransferase